MRLRLGILVAMVTVLSVCASGYDSQTLRYGDPINVRPTWTYLDMKWQQTGTSPSDSDCVFGLTKAGIGVIGAVAAPPVGVTAWFVFSAVVGGAAGLDFGDILGKCWERYNTYHTVFEVYTQCRTYDAVLHSTYTDWAAATAYVQMPSCKCSLMCQWGFQDPPDAAPGIGFSTEAFDTGKSYWHDGANHVNRAETEPVPIDYDALAANMGLTYTAGCDGVGVYWVGLRPAASC